MKAGELYHHGVKGMKWGIQRKLQNYKYSRERKMIDRNLKNPNNSFGPNQSAVMSQRNSYIGKNKNVNAKWKAAFKAGKGTKEWAEYEQAYSEYIHKLNKQFKKKYTEAFALDTDMYNLSEQGKKYLEDHIEQLLPTK